MGCNQSRTFSLYATLYTEYKAGRIPNEDLEKYKSLLKQKTEEPPAKKVKLEQNSDSDTEEAAVDLLLLNKPLIEVKEEKEEQPVPPPAPRGRNEEFFFVRSPVDLGHTSAIYRRVKGETMTDWVLHGFCYSSRWKEAADLLLERGAVFFHQPNADLYKLDRVDGQEKYVNLGKFAV